MYHSNNIHRKTIIAILKADYEEWLNSYDLLKKYITWSIREFLLRQRSVEKYIKTPLLCENNVRRHLAPITFI